MVKVNKKITSLIWISPVVAAIVLASACSSSKKNDTPAPDPTPQQVAPAQTPAATPAPTPAQTPSAQEAITRMNALTISIVNSDKLAGDVKDGALTITFAVPAGTDTSGMTFQCKSGKLPGVLDAAYAPCTSATTQAVSGLTDPASYEFFVKAIDTASGATSKEFSSAIDLSGTAAAQPQYSSTTVGDSNNVGWNIMISPNLYISEKASATTLSGQISLIEEASSSMAFSTGANVAPLSSQVSPLSMKDGSGAEHTYNSVLITQNSDFQALTNHRISRNSVTLTRPITSIQTPGTNAYGTTGFERVIVNVYDSAQLNAPLQITNPNCTTPDTDFQSVRDLFIRICGINNSSQWYTFPAFSDATSAKLPGAIRTCVASVDFGVIGLPAQQIVLAQALEFNPSSQNVQTEVVYMLQLGAYGVTSSSQMVTTLASLIQNSFHAATIMAAAR